MFSSICVVSLVVLGSQVTPAAPQATRNNTHIHTMITNISLPESAALAIEDLEARKRILLSLYPTQEERNNVIRRRDRPELCNEVPAFYDSGSSGIHSAIESINWTIAEIIKRCLVDRNWRD